MSGANMAEIKNELAKYVGQKVVLTANKGRGRNRVYEGIIQNTYDSLFIISVAVEDTVQIQSYTYGDVLTKCVKMKFC